MANVNIKRNTKRILVFTINKNNYAFLIVEKKKEDVKEICKRFCWRNKI